MDGSERETIWFVHRSRCCRSSQSGSSKWPRIHPHIYSNGHLCLNILDSDWGSSSSACPSCPCCRPARERSGRHVRQSECRHVGRHVRQLESADRQRRYGICGPEWVGREGGCFANRTLSTIHTPRPLLFAIHKMRTSLHHCSLAGISTTALCKNT